MPRRKNQVAVRPTYAVSRTSHSGSGVVPTLRNLAYSVLSTRAGRDAVAAAGRQLVGTKRKNTSSGKTKSKKKRQKTKRKNTALNRRSADDQAAPTQTGFHHYFKKKGLKVSSKWGWKYINQGSGNYVWTSSEGQQGYFNMPGILTVPQMTSTSDTSALANDTTFDCLPWDLNPYKYNTGSALFTGGANITFPYYEDRIYLQKVSGFLDLLNTSSVSAAFVDVYWLVSKQALAVTPSAQVANAVIHDSFANADATKGQVAYVQRRTALGTGAGAGTVGYPTMDVYGMHPQQLPSFSKFFKIIRKDNMVLSPGESRRTYATFHYNESQLKV